MRLLCGRETGVGLTLWVCKLVTHGEQGGKLDFVKKIEHLNIAPGTQYTNSKMFAPGGCVCHKPPRECVHPNLV